jgi:hypothetical protein
MVSVHWTETTFLRKKRKAQNKVKVKLRALIGKTPTYLKTTLT